MIKSFIKKIIAYLLRVEAEFVLNKYRPKIVAVAGSVGKTSTKDALVAVLSAEHFVRGSDKSYNSEFGVPLTILGCRSAWNNPVGWLRNLLEGVALIIFKNPYPEWLVLEVGADRPGDIGAIAKWLKVDAVVLTHFPAVPVHVEFFSSPEALHEEDFRLVTALKMGGTVILNADDELMMDKISKIKGTTLTYGFSDGAEVRANNEKITYEEGENPWPSGLTFQLLLGGSSFPVYLNGLLGKHQIYPALAALAFGQSQGLNIVTMLESIKRHEGPPGRLRLIKGVKDTLILDDTYNSSPAALSAALKTLSELTVRGRKIAVIGDMLELGSFTIEAHKEAGRQAAEVCDAIFTVGLRAKFVDEGAREKKFNAKKIFHHTDAAATGVALQAYLGAGDIVLIKASQSIRLEKVVEEVMLEPEKKAAYLCRQDREWVGR